MNHIFKIFLASFFFVNLVCGQTLHPLEPIKGHYLELHQLSPEPNPENTTLTQQRYPSEGRNSGKSFIGLEPTYLSKDQVTKLKSSLQFPANSSQQTRAELDYLLKLQDTRTESQQNRAFEIARIGYWPPMNRNATRYGLNLEDLFWEYRQVSGKKINSDQYPATTKLLAGVTRDMRIMEFTVKYHLGRPRPYQIESKLQPLSRISNPSFASGHTLWAYIQAFTWSELIPNKRTEFLDIAYEVGESREIMGIHYPSDEEAARVLAHAMLSMMWENPEFQSHLKAARLEWR